MDRFTDDRDYALMARERAKLTAVAKFDALPDSALVSVRDLAALFSQGVSTVWRKAQKDPAFPKPIKLSAACTRFVVGDIRKYVATLSDSDAYRAKTAMAGEKQNGDL